MYQFKPELPFVPGSEVAGTVRSAPEGSGLNPGDDVYGFCFLGAFGDVAATLPATTFKLPERLDYAQGASIILNYHTAYFALKLRGRLAEGEAFHFEVHDLSLGGVGVRTTDARVNEWSAGMSLTNCELSLGALGKISIDLELVSHRPTALPNGTQRHQLGFRFLTLPRNVEGKLQRLITQLEVKRNALAR
jgi:c-di-GMP-binding flagellar brake protein YcgR